MSPAPEQLPDGRPLPRGEGRSLPPTPMFAGDDGSTDPLLARALAAGDGIERLQAVVAALATARVLVPVVSYVEERAEPAEHEIHGTTVELAGEKSASAAMVTLATPDGRAAIPVFSGMDALRAWRADARPIPAEGVRAALAAVSDADGLLVLDPGGPVTVPVPRPAVWALAQQRSWVPAAQDPAVAEAIGRTLAAVPGVSGSTVQPGADAELRIVLHLPPGLTREQVQQIVQHAGEALAAEEMVAERVDSLQFQVRSA
ncbi:SseB family protein [Ruania zhangjianzhongii]|uniref:SseB family protein n=1 Tax=Ruania zhangjianzhongii TaxID=2603206 RepID=UPI0011CA22A6|nr:SseB family protein [Ruania zhangjianzhongii]